MVLLTCDAFKWNRQFPQSIGNGYHCVRPHLQSLILANQVFQDKESNNFVIAGTFNRLLIRQIQPNEDGHSSETSAQPVKKSINELRQAGSPWLYFSLTDIVGHVACSIRYVFLKDNQVLFSTAFSIDSKDRLATFEHRLALPPLPCIGFGQYAIEFFAHDEMIGSLRVMAVADESDAKGLDHESQRATCRRQDI